MTKPEPQTLAAVAFVVTALVCVTVLAAIDKLSPEVGLLVTTFGAYLLPSPFKPAAAK